MIMFTTMVTALRDLTLIDIHTDWIIEHKVFKAILTSYIDTHWLNICYLLYTILVFFTCIICNIYLTSHMHRLL